MYNQLQSVPGLSPGSKAAEGATLATRSPSNVKVKEREEL